MEILLLIYEFISNKPNWKTKLPS